MNPTAIAICEDQAQDMERLAGLIEGSLAARGQACAIHRFLSGEALIEAFRPGRFDWVFLDMYLGGANGIETARALRREDERLSIVFTTFSPEFALESYRVRAVHYLMKPVSEADLAEVWARGELTARPAEHITLMVDRRPLDIALADILYIEAENKLCRIHTSKEVLCARISIDQLALMLKSPPFCRCHRGYIANFDHVARVNGDFVLNNGAVVYIRKNEQARIRQMYFQYLIGSARD